MHFPLNRVLPILAVLAMLGAQMFGLQRGYLCDLTGQSELTSWDHCHGDHDHDHAQHSHSEDEHCPAEEGEPVHEHTAQVEQFLADQVHEQLSLPAGGGALHIILWEEPFFIAAHTASLQCGIWLLRPHETGPPLWPQILSHSIELLV
jgi:hypothetical protein